MHALSTCTRFLCLAFILTGLTSMSACGYKGALQHPPPPTPEQSLTTPPSPTQPLQEN